MTIGGLFLRNSGGWCRGSKGDGRGILKRVFVWRGYSAAIFCGSLAGAAVNQARIHGITSKTMTRSYKAEGGLSECAGLALGQPQLPTSPAAGE